MEPVCPVGLLLLAGSGLVVLLLVGLFVLVKMGVFVSYAAREEEPDQGDYRLDDSHEVNE